jgi:FtsZ-interacting cell division protein ZipA
MSDLQVALIISGAFIIAGVVVYNWMQERKLRKEVTSEFIVPQKDVLAEDFYIDTDVYVDKELAGVAEKIKSTEHIASKEMQNKSLTADNDETVEITNKIQNSEVHLSIEAPAEKPTTHKELPQKLSEELQPEPIIQAVLHEKLQSTQAHLPDSTHPQIDLTAILYATKNINSKDLAALSDLKAHIGLPMMIHGLDNDGKWHVVDESLPSATFKQVACSLQLADRGGPVTKQLLNKFQFSVEDCGLALNAHVEWQGSGDAMQRAIELDKFCIEVDQMVSVHITQGEAPIHGTKFKGLAEVNGLLLKEDGRFHYLANGKEEPLFVLIDTNNQPLTSESLRSNVLKSVTFQLEIPKVNNCEQVFNQMILMAQKMAASLNGRLVDDNQKPLGDLQIEKIRQQLKVIHATMVARGIMPGSPSSMRLFN